MPIELVISFDIMALLSPIELLMVPSFYCQYYQKFVNNSMGVDTDIHINRHDLFNPHSNRWINLFNLNKYYLYFVYYNLSVDCIDKVNVRVRTASTSVVISGATGTTRCVLMLPVR